MKRLLTALTTLCLASMLASPMVSAQSVEQDFGMATDGSHVHSSDKPAATDAAITPLTVVPVKPASTPPTVASVKSVVKPLAVKMPVVVPAEPVVVLPAASVKVAKKVGKKKSVAPTTAHGNLTVTELPRIIKVNSVSAPKAAVTTPVREDKVALLLKEASGTKPASSSSGNWVKTGFSTLLKLAFVLGLAYVTIRGLKRFQDKRETAPHRSRDMQIMDTLKLTPGSTIHVVKIQGKTLLISSTANQVSLLTEIEPDAAVAPEPVAADTRFAQYLEKYCGDDNSASPAGRVAGMLRDATAHLKGRCVVSAVKAGDQDAA